MGSMKWDEVFEKCGMKSELQRDGSLKRSIAFPTMFIQIPSVTFFCYITKGFLQQKLA